MKELLIIPLFFWVSLSSGQTWKRGYVMTMDGAIQRGFIQKNWKGCYGPGRGVVKFRLTAIGNVRTFGPNDISEFGIGEFDIYKTMIAHRETSLMRQIANNLAADERSTDKGSDHIPASYFHRDRYPSRYDTLFLHVICITSRLSLYETYDSWQRYYWMDRKVGNRPWPFTCVWKKCADNPHPYLWGYREELQNIVDACLCGNRGSDIYPEIRDCSYTNWGIEYIFKRIADRAKWKRMYYHSHGLFGIIPFTKTASISGLDCAGQ